MGTIGLDPGSAYQTIRHGAAGSFMLEDRGRRMLDRAFLPPKSALEIFVKDMGLVREAARGRGFETPLSDAAHRLYEAGAPWASAGRTTPASCASSKRAWARRRRRRI